jgi:hypothetical protein
MNETTAIQSAPGVAWATFSIKNLSSHFMERKSNPSSNPTEDLKSTSMKMLPANVIPVKIMGMKITAARFLDMII